MLADYLISKETSGMGDPHPHVCSDQLWSHWHVVSNYKNMFFFGGGGGIGDNVVIHIDHVYTGAYVIDFC